MVLQVVTLPAIAFFIANLWEESLAPEYAVGLIIIAACPGGVTSNLMTHLGKGDTALSISLTAIISVLSVITIPFIVNLGFNLFMGIENTEKLPIAKTIVGIFCITTVPVIIGMIINYKKPQFAQKFEPIARKLASVFFVFIVVAAIVKKWGLLVDSIETLAPVVLIFNLLVMVSSWVTSKLIKLKKPQQVAITLECGLQNGTLAIMIASTFLNNDTMMLPSIGQIRG